MTTSVNGTGRRVKGGKAKPAKRKDSAADRRALTRELLKDESVRQIGDVVRTARRFDRMIVYLVVNYGFGTDSPLDRYVQKNKTGLWDDLQGMMRKLREFANAVEFELPPLPDEFD